MVSPWPRKAAAEAQHVDYVDVSEVLGGNATRWSDAEFYTEPGRKQWRKLGRKLEIVGESVGNSMGNSMGYSMGQHLVIYEYL